jgi:hypothetical protein
MSAGAEAAEDCCSVDHLPRLLRSRCCSACGARSWPGGEVGGLTLAALLTYTLVGEPSRGCSIRARSCTRPWQGTVATRWLQPLGVFAQYGADAAGRWALDLALFAPPSMRSRRCRVNPAGESAAAACSWSASRWAWRLSARVRAAALMVVWQLPVFTVHQVRQAITALLSGGLPLAVLPWGSGSWPGCRSPAGLGALATTSARASAGLVALQAFWAAVLWLAAGRLWAGLQEKLVAYGARHQAEHR